MKRLAGQAGRTLGWVLHHTGMIFITVFFVAALSVGLFAFRLAQGPVQIPGLASRLASVVSGQGIDVHIDRAALAWGGYRAGGAVPLYLRLGGIAVRNAAGVTLATIRDGKLVFFPSALLGGRAPILVSSSNTFFQSSDVPVAMQAAIELGGFVRFAHADIAVKLGAGELGPAGNALPISAGAFTVALSPTDVELTQGVLHLAPRGKSHPVVDVSGAGRLTDTWRGKVVVTVDALSADDLAAFWPAQLLVQTRTWVTQNISAGQASGANVTIGLSAPKTLASLSLESAAGGFSGSDLSIGWIPHAQLITGVAGTLTVTDDDDIDIKATAGTLGGLTLAGGTMHISGLLRHTQIGSFAIPITGTVQQALGLLNAPPLNLLKTAPPQLLSATGALTGTVAATLPLRGDVTLDQVDLHVATALTSVTVPTPLQGLNLTAGTLDVAATAARLRLTGAATLAGQAARLAAAATFGAGQPTIDFTLTSQAGTQLLQTFGAALGPDETGGILGAVPFTLHITQAIDGGGLAELQADLTPAAVAVPALGWEKKAGIAGHLDVKAALDGQAVTNITAIEAAAPGLNLQAAIDPIDPKQLDVSALRIGATAGQGAITAPASPDKPWRLAFSGPALDITAILNPAPKSAKPPKPSPPKPKPPSGPLWQAKLRFATFILAAHGAPVLGDLAFDGNGEGQTILAAHATATGPAGGVTLTVTPAPGPLHPQDLTLRTGDGGFLLRALGAYSNITGGTLDLTATASDDGTSGTVKLQNFRLMQAPGFAKVLQTMTIYGAAEAASGPGLIFDRLVAPFTIVQDVLTLKGARAFSSSLGFTASGTINLASGTTDLHTTIVPAYALNVLPGKIPLVGPLFSAEQGGGLFAIRAKIAGQLTNPDITINPLSALTPGVLRDVFGEAGAK